MDSDRKFGFHFSKKYALEFLLLIALPVHFWAWILWFQASENFSQNHGLWDALVIGSYFMAFALFESAAIFGIIPLLMLLHRRLDQRKVFSVTASIYLALTFAITMIVPPALL